MNSDIHMWQVYLNLAWEDFEILPFSLQKPCKYCIIVLFYFILVKKVGEKWHIL